VEKLIIVGGGGHAKVILDVVEESGDFEAVGCIARDAPNHGELSVPFLGDESSLPHLRSAGVQLAFVAVGDNRARSELSQRVLEQRFQIVNIVSRHAVVSRGVELGWGIAIMPGAVINSGTKIGNGCIINTGVMIDHDCKIAAWGHLAPGTVFAGSVETGEGAFLGVGARVIQNISIGAWTTVGAGGVVIRNLPANVCAVGVPARILSEQRGTSEP
jgi:UDP-perosamine 4-acetyltransferase